MAKNDFLARQRAIQQAFFDAGIQSGRQQIMDMMSPCIERQSDYGQGHVW